MKLGGNWQGKADTADLSVTDQVRQVTDEYYGRLRQIDGLEIETATLSTPEGHLNFARDDREPYTDGR